MMLRGDVSSWCSLEILMELIVGYVVNQRRYNLLLSLLNLARCRPSCQSLDVALEPSIRKKILVVYHSILALVLVIQGILGFTYYSVTFFHSEFYLSYAFEIYPDSKVANTPTLTVPFSLFLFKYRNRYPFFLRKHYSSQAVGLGGCR